MDRQQLIRLADTYAAHVDRSLNIVAVRAGQHNRLFERLKKGLGCHIDTFNETVAWFAANWPDDLAWPADVPRPPQTPKSKVA